MIGVPDAWAVEAASLPLTFAQVREDPRLDMELASTLPPGATVVMIASGGDTAVCLGRLPLRLHLVDINPAQLALSQVKWRLAGRRDAAAAKRLLGHRPLAEDERWRLLGEMLGKLGLANDFLGPRDVVARIGADHAGRYERTFAELRDRLSPLRGELEAALLAGAPVLDLEDSPLGEAMNRAFAEVMSLANLVCLFGEGATRNPRVAFSTHFAARTHEIFRRMAPNKNPFLWQILAGEFPPAVSFDGLVDEGLSPGVSAHWHVGKMDGFLESFATAGADLVHLSNILDWLSPAEGQLMLAQVARVLKPGGRVIIRQLNSTLDIPAIESGLAWESDFGMCMEQRDRSYFYPKIHVGRKQ